MRTRQEEATVTSNHDITVEVDGPDWLVVSQPFDGIAPEDLVRWFVEPELLTRWWGQEATVEPEIGGCWEVCWPAMGWTLRGEIAELTARSLIVNWAWDHEPDLPARALVVRAEVSPEGVRLRIIQGPYRQGEALPREDDDRASHRDGWQHFLPGLVTAVMEAHNPAREAPAVSGE